MNKDNLYFKIKKSKYVYLILKIKKLELRVNTLKKENLLYKNLNKNIIDKNNKTIENKCSQEIYYDTKKNKDEEYNHINKNTNIENTSYLNNNDNDNICDECGFEIDEKGCICPDICKNEDCENYDEDEYNEICNICKNKANDSNTLDDELDELYEESNTLSDVEMGEELCNEKYSNINTNKKRKKYNKLNEDDENLKVINKLSKLNSNLHKNKQDSVFDNIKLNNRNTLKLFNDIYIKYSNNQIDDNYINDIYEIYDKNKSRFMKNLEISFKIYNNNKVSNSNFVFPLYTFNSIKKTSIDNFIALIEKLV